MGFKDFVKGVAAAYAASERRNATATIQNGNSRDWKNSSAIVNKAGSITTAYNSDGTVTNVAKFGNNFISF